MSDKIQDAVDPKLRSVANDTDPTPVEFGKGRTIDGGTTRRDKNKIRVEQYEVIIGDDNRIEVTERAFPHNCICLLVIMDKAGNEYYGSGFFISPRCIVTSGHCVYFNKSWAKAIKVIPGAIGDTAPFGSAISRRFQSVGGWTEDADDDFDYGAVLLDDDALYDNLKASLECACDTDVGPIVVSGYPSDKKKTQWKAQGSIKKLTDYRIFYDVDTVKGNSGSPAFYFKNGKPIVIGVHSGGESINYSLRLREQVITRLKEWAQTTIT